MTGFDSKRNAAKAKLDDDGDTQVDAAVLTIVYQRGFADGKKAANAMHDLARLGQEIEQEQAEPCIGKDSRCPCQDGDACHYKDCVGTKARPVAQPEQEPVAHSVIAGALFDFMGWLTSRKERLVLSSVDDASPAVVAITEFAKMRGLSLNDARVQDWQDYTTPPQRPWVGLTDEEVLDLFDVNNVYGSKWIEFARTVEAKLKVKNDH